MHDGTSEPILDTSQGLISAVGGQDLNALEFEGAEVHVGAKGANNAMVVDEGWSGAGPITSWVSHPSAIGYRLQGVVSAGSGSGGGGGGSGSGSGGGGTITIAAVSPDFDSGMNDGTDGQELERVANFYTGTEENPTSAQSAPTPRAEQEISDGVPPGNPIAVPTSTKGSSDGEDPPPSNLPPVQGPGTDPGDQPPPGQEPANDPASDSTGPTGTPPQSPGESGGPPAAGGGWFRYGYANPANWPIAYDILNAAWNVGRLFPAAAEKSDLNRIRGEKVIAPDGLDNLSGDLSSKKRFDEDKHGSDEIANGVKGLIELATPEGGSPIVPGMRPSMGAIGGMGAFRRRPVAPQEHHLMTNKNNRSTAAGGPYTPKFQALADRRGISLDDAINRMMLPGHQGPHPRYNAEVYRQMYQATQGKRGDAFRQAFDNALNEIHKETARRGSLLNKLATGG